MVHLAAIVLCIVFWPVTLVVLGFMLILFLLKMIAMAILGIGFAIFYPSPVVNASPIAHNLTSVPGQMFALWILGFIAFCGVMAYYQHKKVSK